MTRSSCLAALGVVIALVPFGAGADPVADFYRGKTINIVVPASSGGDIDQRARMLARHIGKHIPGNPTIVARNMPGGGGVTAANWLHHNAPRDGTAMEAVMPTMPMSQALDLQGVQFDVREWSWIGNTTDSPDVITIWHTAGVRTIEDAKKREVIFGAPGANSPSAYNPLGLNAIVGTKFKLIVAYPGGNDVNLAMERGEVEARNNTWASWVSGKPDWIAEKKILPLVQIALKRHPDLRDVPLMMELGKTDEEREILRLMSTHTAMSRAFATTPGVPKERVDALRRAFDASMKDPELLAEAEKARRDLSPISGEEVQQIAAGIVNAPKAARDRIAEIIKQAEKLESATK